MSYFLQCQHCTGGITFHKLGDTREDCSQADTARALDEALAGLRAAVLAGEEDAK